MRRKFRFKLWHVLVGGLALIGFIVVLRATGTIGVLSASAEPAQNSLSGIVPTQTQTPDPYGPPATDSPTAIPQPTFTTAPTDVPTALPQPTVTTAPTDVPTAEPTLAPTVDAALTEVTLKDGTKVMVDLGTDWQTYPKPAMDAEFGKVAQAENPRPADRKGIDIEIAPGQTKLIFSEGRVVFPDGSVIVNVGGQGRENATFVTNTGSAVLAIKLEGYAASGFSLLTFVDGAEPNTALWGRYPLSRITHCGLANLAGGGGCKYVKVANVQWDGNVTTNTETVYTETDALPADNSVIATVANNGDWESKSGAQAIADELVLIDQEPEVLGSTASIGVTWGKPIVVMCASGFIFGPKGSGEIDMKADPGVKHVAILYNNVGDTVVFAASGLTECTMYEYALGNVPHGPLLARASIGFDSVSKAVVHTATYDLLGALNLATNVDVAEYDQPLP